MSRFRTMPHGGWFLFGLSRQQDPAPSFGDLGISEAELLTMNPSDVVDRIRRSQPPKRDLVGLDENALHRQVRAIVEAAVDGHAWLAGSKLGGVNLSLILTDEPDEDEPSIFERPDRTYGVIALEHSIDVRVIESKNLHGAALALAGEVFAVLEWLKDKYHLPDMPPPGEALQVPNSDDEPPFDHLHELGLILATIAPGEFGLVIPLESDEEPDSERLRVLEERADAAIRVLSPTAQAVDATYEAGVLCLTYRP